MKGLMSKTVQRITHSVEGFGRFSLFTANVFKWAARPPWRLYLLGEQMEHIGVMSVPIILLSSLAIGMIFSLQLGALLSMFRAEFLSGAAVAKSTTRELAPVITSLMLIARNGSAMTAEIGTMRATEQIDAIETMSVNPVQYLVVPRVAASILCFPVLTGICNIVSVVGSYLIAVVFSNVDEASYMDQLFKMVNPADIYSGLIKAAVMGFLVSVICCYYGYYARGGAKGVGTAATGAVVSSSVSILIADYVMSDLMLKLVYY
ncbi:MAG: ABC transporter permease [Spirochaetales bacterium]|nr:ABC transporter permease [Spirochaetales bacterium]